MRTTNFKAVMSKLGQFTVSEQFVMHSLTLFVVTHTANANLCALVQTKAATLGQTMLVIWTLQKLENKNKI